MKAQTTLRTIAIALFSLVMAACSDNNANSRAPANSNSGGGTPTTDGGGGGTPTTDGGGDDTPTTDGGGDDTPTTDGGGDDTPTSDGGGDGTPTPDGGGSADGRNFLITPGPNATEDMVTAMIAAAPGDVIEFDCGFFELTSTLLLSNTEDVLIKGCGMDQTVLSFRENDAPEGILIVNVGGIRIEDLTVADTGGNGFELRAVNHGTLSRVRAFWSSDGGRESPDPITADNFIERMNVACTDPATQDPTVPENEGGDITSPDYTVSPRSGRYGIYPVSSENILIQNSESIGASDAGIYVGQTSNAIIRDSRAVYNVFGFEIENVQGGEYRNNLAECNTGGFLVYDLDGLRQYGDRTRMIDNISRNNNTYNFTSGGIVGNVPSGSGMITLSYDRIDVVGNTFENNNTAGIIHTSYEIFPEGAGRPGERRIDFYTEGMRIADNVFRNNGNALPPPSSSNIANQDVAKFLPALVGAKTQAACSSPENAQTCAEAGGDGMEATGYRGAHIIWDGLMDSHNPDCAYPKDGEGNDVPADERGKPLYTNDHPNPDCRYNAYKFDTAAEGAPRRVPDWWFSCIDANNDFGGDSLTFSNFRGTKGANAAIKIAIGQQPTPEEFMELNEFPASFDLSLHQCVAAYGSDLAPLPPVVIPEFERSGDIDPAPSPAQVEALCNATVADGEVNFAAAPVNCPRLDQYNLFADLEDPTSLPNGGGVPYSLNSKLFSDYSVKYRVMYLPPGETATYRDSGSGSTPSEPNHTIQFPLGTIIAKTFSFANETDGTEQPVETRLLIKRVSSRGIERWDGVSYRWEMENGEAVANLALAGATLSVNWDVTDVDSRIRHTGSTSSYKIPNANECLSCHANSDLEPGSAPIGPKVRFMNKVYQSESGRSTAQSTHPIAGQNQIAYLCSNGLMSGCPDNLALNENGIATALNRIPVFNKPGDFDPNNEAADVEARARAWLEVNCQHCHNPRGFASNTGFYVDSFRPVNDSYGICKRPTATGQEGSGGRTYDIHPGVSLDSIVSFRISPEATLPAARMPPLARSVVDAEGHALIEQWIDSVVEVDEDRYPNSGNCVSN